jgi:tetratricopeptide (TPR) repeat protein
MMIGSHRYALAIVDEKSLTLHRLVRLVILDKLSGGAHEYKQYANYAVRIVEKLFPDITDYNNYELCKELLYHAQVSAQNAEIAQVALDEAGSLYSEIGMYLRERGDYRSAVDYTEKSVLLGEQILGLEHPEIAIRYNNLAIALQDIKDFTRAKYYVERTISIDERIYGVEHENVATGYNNLALVLIDMGDYSSAKTYLEKAIKIGEQRLGKEHRDVAIWYNSIGMALYHLREFSDAKTYLEKAIEIGEKIYGKDYPAVGKWYSNYARVLYTMGDLSGAKDYLSKALSIFEAKLGKEHKETKNTARGLTRVKEEMRAEFIRLLVTRVRTEVFHSDRISYFVIVSDKS